MRLTRCEAKCLESLRSMVGIQLARAHAGGCLHLATVSDM